ncbi:UNVERIFIED_CONTAM: 3-ketoacyl-CoA synthase 20 [Sesamum latifolium]|uniref:3-ketoacyl-CoA synthase n=1 Tax=Sesamum latifolium TaxID=2727402 RepID=A0AAW2U2L4_9LAMI
MASQNSTPSYHKQPNFLFSDQLKTYTKLSYNFVISKSVYLFIIPAILCASIHHLSALYFDQTTITDQLYKYYANGRCSFMVGDTICQRLETVVSPESIEFCRKVMEKSGVSENAFVYGWNEFPPKSGFDCGRGEAETVICGAVGDLMAKTGVNPRDIGGYSEYLDVQSSALTFRHDRKQIQTQRRCAELQLGRHGLQCWSHCCGPRQMASTESPTSSYYVGDDRSKLISNCLFRMGGAALLLSNRSSDHQISKYELKHTVRTHHGADDKAYTCALQEVDNEGKLGVSISKDLMGVAGKALKVNISALGPLVLPISEQLLFLVNYIVRKLFKIKGTSPYVPDFKLAFNHFCIHAGGKAVLNEVEKNLNLTKWQMEPSRMTLYRYSNTSSSSIWYELAYAEAKGRIQKGDRIWQIAFGTGFKCGSAVWRALRTIDPARADNPWSDVIDHFPINISN